MRLSAREVTRARLAAIVGARRALRDLGQAEADWIDPFAAIEDAGALLMFQPLKSLCGAYLPRPSDGGAAGVVLSTQFPASVQRFTAAHELGHLWMKHRPSLDRYEDLLPRAVRRTAGGSHHLDAQEVAADAFAGHFLMPQRLVQQRMERLKIGSSEVRNSERVYELSLWFGTSYTAMVWHLHALKLLGREDSSRLASVQPKTLKKALLGSHTPSDWRNDVWPLKAAQSGSLVHARVGDTFAVDLPNRASSGYLWAPASNASSNAFEMVHTETTQSSQRTLREISFGEVKDQRALVRVTSPGRVKVSLEDRRPWESKEPLETFTLTIQAEPQPEVGLGPGGKSRHLSTLRAE